MSRFEQTQTQPTTEPVQDARFAGKVAFVSGATSGIGRATALALAREGARVVVDTRRVRGDLTGMLR